MISIKPFQPVLPFQAPRALSSNIMNNQEVDSVSFGNRQPKLDVSVAEVLAKPKEELAQEILSLRARNAKLEEKAAEAEDLSDAVRRKNEELDRMSRNSQPNGWDKPMDLRFG